MEKWDHKLNEVSFRQKFGSSWEKGQGVVHVSARVGGDVSGCPRLRQTFGFWLVENRTEPGAVYRVAFKEQNFKLCLKQVWKQKPEQFNSNHSVAFIQASPSPFTLM